MMCQVHWKRAIGICSICFGAGILLSFFLPGYFLAFIEAAALIVAGILLLGKRR